MKKLVLLSVLLASCGSPAVFHKHGASDAEKQTDLARCEYEAKAATASSRESVLMVMTIQSDLVRSCLAAKGYTRVQ